MQKPLGDSMNFDRDSIPKFSYNSFIDEKTNICVQTDSKTVETYMLVQFGIGPRGYKIDHVILEQTNAVKIFSLVFVLPKCCGCCEYWQHASVYTVVIST
jgi:hypothetical protein